MCPNVPYGLFGFAEGVEPARVSARIDQLAAYIGAASLAVITIAVWDSWRNGAIGHWANLILVSVLDVDYFVFVVLPTDLPPFEEWTGPVVWLIVAALSTTGYVLGRTGASRR